MIAVAQSRPGADRGAALAPFRQWIAAQDASDHGFCASGPRTGHFINILVRSLARPNMLEIGVSPGSRGIWLAEAARATGGRLTTFEPDPRRSAAARRMSEQAGLAGCADFRGGDAVAMIGDLAEGIDFVLVDPWREFCAPCLAAVHPRLNPGAILVACDTNPAIGAAPPPHAGAIRALPGMRAIRLALDSGLEISTYAPG